MNPSSLFSSLLDSPLVVIYISAIIIALCIGWIVRLEIKIKKLVGGAGKDAHSLEDVIVDAHKKIEDLAEFKKDSIEYFKEIETRLGRSIQAIETVRFNPFKGTGEGGNQSFSTALLSEKGDGVVISSLYSRDRVSIFSKPLKKYTSDFELTEEEKGVVGNAKDLISKK